MFERLSLEQGLSQNSIYSIVQDSDDYMWFGTEEGLNKYDGVKFKIYKNRISDQNSIADNFVKKLIIDKSGQLWAGTLNGFIFRYNKFMDNFSNISIDNESDEVKSELTSFLCMEDKSMLVGSYYGGIKVLDNRISNIRAFKPGNNDFDISNLTDVSALYEDSFGLIWICSWDKGIFIYNKMESTIKKLEDHFDTKVNLRSNAVRCIFEDSDSNIWIGTIKGLNIFNRKKNDLISCPKMDIISNKDILIFSILEDNSKNKWIATYTDGLLKIDDKNKLTQYCHEKNDYNSISTNSIYSLYLDRSNVLWIGTLGGGINKLDCGRKRFYNLKYANEKNEEIGSVVKILVDSKNNHWISTFSNGIKIFKRDNSFLTLSENIDLKNHSHEAITSIIEDDKNNVWLCCLRKDYFYKYNLLTNELSEFQHPFKFGINSIFYINSYLYIAIREKGILKFDTVNEKFVKYDNDDPFYEKLKTKIIYCSFIDSKKSLWLGTIREGLYKCDFKKKEILNFTYIPNDDTSISDNCITCIAEDSSGNIWIGTKNGGLNKYIEKSNSFQRINSSNGLPNEYIKGILEDSSNNLWISSNSGLTKYNFNTQLVKNYVYSDGIQSNEFNDGAFFKDKSGSMFFGGVNGVTYFNPEDIGENSFLPNTVITDFEIFNESVEGAPDNPFLKKNITYAEEIKLTYKESVFSFRFASLIYNNPQKNQYAYKMEGFDKDWTYSETRKRVTYTNLNPGNYVFRVKGSNNDGKWNEEGTSVKINISPPYWKTWWFKSLGALSLAAITGLSYKQRLNKIEKEKKAQEEFSRKLIESQETERKRIAHDLHETIAHEFLISKQKAALALKHKNDNKKMEEALKEISELSSSAINEVRSIAYNLHPHQLERLGLTKTIISNINQADKSTNISFSADIDDIDNILSKENEINLFRVIHEIISNIIKHSKATKANFKVKLIAKSIYCLISDNGTGFNVSSKLLPGAKEGIGLEGIAERIKYMGEYKIESEPGKGTVYKIKIPIKEINYG
ncbi:MAG: hypothetical protein HGGPFJEG_02107 [Ignavibacteria bacterium]|nr:hypothetical protein [Ignavibacteria bacterium]